MSDTYIDNADAIDTTGMSGEAASVINDALANRKHKRRVGAVRKASRDPRYINANIEPASDIVIANVRRTPPQLTSQADLDGQSREIDSMCSNDTEGN